jgi:hypothetical protein
MGRSGLDITSLLGDDRRQARVLELRRRRGWDRGDVGIQWRVIVEMCDAAAKIWGWVYGVYLVVDPLLLRAVGVALARLLLLRFLF